jgi:hypothetical protein
VKLSDHFTLEQLTASSVALRKGIPNVPSADTIENLKILAQTLERIQEIVGPIHIDSAYRSIRVNLAVGGSAHSAHIEGYAADIVAPGFGTPLEVCKAIAGSGIHFDQLLQEGTWTHISIDPKMRQEILTAHFLNGKVAYTQGLEVA